MRGGRIKRDPLLGLPSRSEKPAPTIFSIGKDKWLVLSIFVAACIITLAVVFLASQRSDEKLQAVNPLNQDAEIASPFEAAVERGSASTLAAERQYRNQVEDEEIVRLLNEQPSKNGGRAIDLSGLHTAAQEKAEEAVKEARAGNSSLEKSRSSKTTTEVGD